jgi:tetratricopeptide (TPR) repeat protein
MELVVRSALVILTGLIAAACSATAPNPRPLASGFATGSGVADPYADGKLHLAAGRYDTAVERFAQALATDRTSLDAMNGLGIAYTRLGHFDIAQTYFERALQVDPTNVATLNNYGWSLTEQGRFQEAKPFLELALRHADQADAPVVTGNIENLRRARPSALVAYLEGNGFPGARAGPRRLVRVDDHAYRLETTAAPATAHDGQSQTTSLAPHASTEPTPADRRPRPDVPSASSLGPEGVSRDDGAPPSASQAVEPERDRPANRPFGAGPIPLWPEPPSGSEADAIRVGERT